MHSVNYEPHTHNDPFFPIIFHRDYIAQNARFLIHYHENIELLYIIKGAVSVFPCESSVKAEKGDVVVINANQIHYVKALGGSAEYYCLIVDRGLCSDFGISTDETVFKSVVSDKRIGQKFNEIKDELVSKRALYKSAVKSHVAELMIRLYRNYKVSETPFPEEADSKIEMVKKSIKYIQDNYSKTISTSDIAKQINLSEPYLCRVFKSVTGVTVINYLNYLRCSNARALFLTGKYTVNEVAAVCGFDNLSYFSKVYKKHIGRLPSSDKKISDDVNVGDGIPTLYFT